MNFLGEEAANITFNPRDFFNTWCKMLFYDWSMALSLGVIRGKWRTAGDHLAGKWLFTVSRKMEHFAKFAKNFGLKFRKLSVLSNGKVVQFFIQFQGKSFVFSYKLRLRGGTLSTKVSCYLWVTKGDWCSLT